MQMTEVSQFHSNEQDLATHRGVQIHLGQEALDGMAPGSISKDFCAQISDDLNALWPYADQECIFSGKEIVTGWGPRALNKLQTDHVELQTGKSLGICVVPFGKPGQEITRIAYKFLTQRYRDGQSTPT